MTTRPTDWCILRMAAPRTVIVVRSLRRAGIEAWTPTELVPYRSEETRKRGRRPIPLLSTFAFARVEYLPELIGITADPVSPHPDFSILRHGDGFALIEDIELTALRIYERDSQLRADRKLPPPEFKIGAEVTLPKRDAFASMNGVIEAKEGKFYVLVFPGSTLRIKAEPWEMKAA